MLYLLLTRPELRQWWQERPEARDALLRNVPHRSSVGLARIALEDVDLRGHRIRAGDPVYVSYLAANRDPDVFPEPDRIDPGRAPTSIWPSATDRTTAPAPSSPASRPSCRSPPCCSGCPGCASRSPPTRSPGGAGR